MITLYTYLRSDEYDELIPALTYAGVGHLITGQHYQVSLVFPDKTEVMSLSGDIARRLYRTPNGTVFAWVDTYEGEQEVFQLSSQRAWNLNQARGMRVISQ